nr:DinB family protein [Actinopolymorpha rutila]
MLGWRAIITRVAWVIVTAEWTAPPVERAGPDHVAAERRALEQWLDYHRDTLLMKCAGMTPERLKLRGVPSSNLSLLGLVRHLADAERGWFRQCAAGQDVPDLYWTEADSGADFNNVEAAEAEADLDLYRREIVAAREAVAGKGLDDVVPFRWGGPDRDLRWIYLHMIEEYARHNGHADLIREAIDGVTGD